MKICSQRASWRKKKFKKKLKKIDTLAVEFQAGFEPTTPQTFNDFKETTILNLMNRRIGNAKS
jgi:hypothetical protein